jgi:hypothetical protein
MVNQFQEFQFLGKGRTLQDSDKSLLNPDQVAASSQSILAAQEIGHKKDQVLPQFSQKIRAI